jgi:hypothetical protein
MKGSPVLYETEIVNLCQCHFVNKRLTTIAWRTIDSFSVMSSTVRMRSEVRLMSYLEGCMHIPYSPFRVTAISLAGQKLHTAR